MSKAFKERGFSPEDVRMESNPVEIGQSSRGGHARLSGRPHLDQLGLCREKLWLLQDLQGHDASWWPSGARWRVWKWSAASLVVKHFRAERRAVNAAGPVVENSCESLSS